ncbi:hypothetical protein [Massilia oculi]|uniref:hypothetical protein n=1 Tax=Massilia oculi TaxID=945844 RepID=UPI001E623E1F|nr:hypothetical protein [Massilia oculi]
MADVLARHGAGVGQLAPAFQVAGGLAEVGLALDDRGAQLLDARELRPNLARRLCQRRLGAVLARRASTSFSCTSTSPGRTKSVLSAAIRVTVPPTCGVTCTRLPST